MQRAALVAAVFSVCWACAPQPSAGRAETSAGREEASTAVDGAAHTGATPATVAARVAHAPSSALIDPVLDGAIEQVLSGWLTPGGPGLALAVVTSRGLRVYRSYGYADVEAELPIDAATLFDLASLSKPLTALAVLLLADRGALSLADPVSRHISEIAGRPSERPLRIGDLLQMASALPEYTNAADALRGAEPPKPEDVLRLVRHTPPIRAPGSLFDYTNTNYVLLALIVERVSGRPFGAFLRDEVLLPLGMTGATVLDATAETVPRRAVGYRRDAKAFLPSRHDVPTLGDGNVVASLADLVAWDRALRRIEAGRAGLVRQATLAAAEQPAWLDSAERYGYGYGWFVATEGPRRVWCAGSAAGTSAYFARYLDAGLSIMLLSNEGGLDVHLVDAVAELYLAR